MSCYDCLETCSRHSVRPARVVSRWSTFTMVCALLSYLAWVSFIHIKIVSTLLWDHHEQLWREAKADWKKDSLRDEFCRRPEYVSELLNNLQGFLTAMPSNDLFDYAILTEAGRIKLEREAKNSVFASLPIAVRTEIGDVSVPAFMHEFRPLYVHIRMLEVLGSSVYSSTIGFEEDEDEDVSQHIKLDENDNQLQTTNGNYRKHIALDDGDQSSKDNKNSRHDIMTIKASESHLPIFPNCLIEHGYELLLDRINEAEYDRLFWNVFWEELHLYPHFEFSFQDEIVTGEELAYPTWVSTADMSRGDEYVWGIVGASILMTVALAALILSFVIDDVRDFFRRAPRIPLDSWALGAYAAIASSNNAQKYATLRQYIGKCVEEYPPLVDLVLSNFTEEDFLTVFGSGNQGDDSRTMMNHFLDTDTKRD